MRYRNLIIFIMFLSPTHHTNNWFAPPITGREFTPEAKGLTILTRPSTGISTGFPYTAPLPTPPQRQVFNRHHNNYITGIQTYYRGKRLTNRPSQRLPYYNAITRTCESPHHREINKRTNSSINIGSISINKTVRKRSQRHSPSTKRQ